MKAVYILLVCLVCVIRSFVDGRTIFPDLSSDQFDARSVPSANNFVIYRTKRGIIYNGKCPSNYYALPLPILYCVPCKKESRHPREVC